MFEKIVSSMESGQIAFSDAVDAVMSSPEILTELGFRKDVESQLRMAKADNWAKKILEASSPEERDALQSLLLRQ